MLYKPPNTIQNVTSNVTTSKNSMLPKYAYMPHNATKLYTCTTKLVLQLDYFINTALRSGLFCILIYPWSLQSPQQCIADQNCLCTPAKGCYARLQNMFINNCLIKDLKGHFFTMTYTVTNHAGLSTDGTQEVGSLC